MNRKLTGWGYAIAGKPKLSNLRIVRKELYRKFIYPVSLAVSERDGYIYWRGYGFYYRNLPKYLRKTFRSIRQMHKKQSNAVRWSQPPLAERRECETYPHD